MAKNGSKQKEKKKIATLTHDKAKRRNIPTAEFQSVMRVEEQSPVRVAYERRNRDLDPQLVWRGKDEQDWSDLVVHAPPLYIQEKVQPKVLIDDLQRRTEASSSSSDSQIDLFADFNGLPNEAAKTEFYQHDAHWSNRMILGDSLQAMASLAEREGLRGQVQCVYIDPPYGIKFNSNFQWSTTSRDVKDGNVEHITREPEQVKAFRDTWRDGIHSYLTYLRDRLSVVRDLLSESGSVFVQIGDENIHRVRAVMDEVFGESNFVASISYATTSGFPSLTLTRAGDSILWYARSLSKIKYRQIFERKLAGDDASAEYKWAMLEDCTTRALTEEEYTGKVPLPVGARRWRFGPLTSSGASDAGTVDFEFQGKKFHPGSGNHWKVKIEGLERVAKSGLLVARRNSIAYYLFAENYPVQPITNVWQDTKWGFDASEKAYVVQTNSKVIQKCILMATDPGDLVLDPTCGSGTTAYVAEQWGRRWITIDTSRVALALARARIMGARYPYYLLSDSREGQLKEGELTRKIPSTIPTHSNVRHGFVYERVPHVTLKSIADNFEIDVIWDSFQLEMESLRKKLNTALKVSWEAWDIPREIDEKWNKEVKQLHAEWWKKRIARQKAIDASIAAKAEFEYLYDKPYEDNKKVRVAGPFTVESLSPHRVVIVDENGDWIDGQPQSKTGRKDEADFVQMILENLKTAGVQQAHKEDKISFSSIAPWPGYFVCAEGKYLEGTEKGSEKRAAIFIGPEFGTVARPDLVAAAREAGDAGFDVLITCAFNYDAHSSEFNKLGRIPVLKARMNADLHMSDELKNTGKGNLFVIFGEPDIDIISLKSGEVQVKVKGVDVFHPNTGEVRSDGAEGIACWFIDTDYNEESFFVRHAYFLGANDPYKALKTSLKAEINEEAWSTLHSDTSRPFTKPASGRIAVKVINHLGDEVMKVFRVN
jgi:adenine-specific DNA-methyltransferase